MILLPVSKYVGWATDAGVSGDAPDPWQFVILESDGLRYSILHVGTHFLITWVKRGAV